MNVEGLVASACGAGVGLQRSGVSLDQIGHCCSSVCRRVAQHLVLEQFIREGSGCRGGEQTGNRNGFNWMDLGVVLFQDFDGAKKSPLSR